MTSAFYKINENTTDLEENRTPGSTEFSLLYEDDIKKLSTYMKLCLVVETILIIINIFILNKAYVFLQFFLLFGIYGITRYHKNTIFAYTIFICFEIILYIVLVIKYKLYFIIYILFEFVNITVSITYLRFIKDLDENEIIYLRENTENTIKIPFIS